MNNKFWADEMLRLYWELRSFDKARLKVREMMKEDKRNEVRGESESNIYSELDS